MSKILVTGASGFIGKALTTKLKSFGYDVVSVDSANGDIANRETLAKFEQQNFSHIFHLAGKTFVPDSWDDPLAFCQTNVLGTINVLELCRRKHIPVTYISAYVYGHPYSLPISEDSPVRPSNPYALTKWLAEEVCEFYASAYDLSVTTVRPFNVYGIGQAVNFLIPAIINQALDGGREIAVKDLAPKRDYVYLEDLISALLATLKRQCGYRIYNIGTGISLSVQEVIDVVQEVAGTHKKVIGGNEVRSNELIDVVADVAKAEKELGWRPVTDFRAGIAKIIHSEREKRSDESA